MAKIKKHNPYSGFTLLELVVSIGILTLMTSLFLVNYHGTNKRSQLSLAAQKIASDIRTAQNYSLGLKKYGGSYYAGGWGIHFDLSSANYVIFCDVDADRVYDVATEGVVANGARRLSLPTGVTVSAITVVGTYVDIVFVPPDPQTVINNDVANKTVQITIRESGTGYTANILTNILGLIDVL